MRLCATVLQLKSQPRISQNRFIRKRNNGAKKNEGAAAPTSPGIFEVVEHFCQVFSLSSIKFAEYLPTR